MDCTKTMFECVDTVGLDLSILFFRNIINKVGPHIVHPPPSYHSPRLSREMLPTSKYQIRQGVGFIKLFVKCDDVYFV